MSDSCFGYKGSFESLPASPQILFEDRFSSMKFFLSSTGKKKGETKIIFTYILCNYIYEKLVL